MATALIGSTLDIHNTGLTIALTWHSAHGGSSANTTQDLQHITHAWTNNGVLAQNT